MEVKHSEAADVLMNKVCGPVTEPAFWPGATKECYKHPIAIARRSAFYLGFSGIFQSSILSGLTCLLTSSDVPTMLPQQPFRAAEND